MDIVGNFIGNAIKSLFGGLVSFVFEVILKVFDILLAPFLLAIQALFPDISVFMSQVLYFLGTFVFPSIRFVMSMLHNLLGIPKELIVFLTAYYTFLMGGKILATAYTSIINLYNKLKP